MDKICYKVVRKRGDHFLSSIFNDYELNYNIGKTTYPKIGKIFVFNNLKNCVSYFNCIGDDQFILKGLATKISFPKYCCLYQSDDFYFWEEFKKRKKTISRSLVPKGTIWCESFTPIEIVECL